MREGRKRRKLKKVKKLRKAIPAWHNTLSAAPSLLNLHLLLIPVSGR